MAGFAMIAGLVQYVLGAKHLGSAGQYPSPAENPERDRRQKRNAGIGAIAVVAILAVIGILGAAGIVELTVEMVSNALGVVLLIIIVAVFSWLLLGKGWTVEERKRSAAILVLFLASALFWSMFEQAGSSLNLFAERATNRNLFGFDFPASWFQFVQPALVVILAPVFAWIWLKLGRREPSSPAKFSMGLLFGGLGFLILVPAASRAANGALVSLWWLNTTYLLHTIGELCLSPVGLSAMTKLAPARVAGFMMGVWFVSISVGNFLAGPCSLGLRIDGPPDSLRHRSRPRPGRRRSPGPPDQAHRPPDVRHQIAPEASNRVSRALVLQPDMTAFLTDDADGSSALTRRSRPRR